MHCADKIYQNAGNRALLDLLPARAGRALDCGCGGGDNARLLRTRGWSVDGVTISAAEATIAAAHCDRVFLADLEQGLPSEVEGPYELVIISHVLEHLVQPGPLLEAIKRLLAPGGVLAVALPNALHYSCRLEFLRGRFEYTSSGVMDDTHVRFYTFASGRRLLERHGYKVSVAVAEGAFPLWKLRRVLPATLVAALNRRATAWRPGVFGHQSLYLAICPQP